MTQLTRYQPNSVLSTAFKVGKHLYQNRDRYSNVAKAAKRQIEDMVKNRSHKRRKASHRSTKRRGKPAPANTVTTFQHDHTTSYRKTKHRVPKSLKIFKAKVRAVEAESRGTHLRVINTGYVVLVPPESSPSNQAASEAHLYSYRGAVGPNRGTMNDLDLITNDADAVRKVYNADGFESIKLNTLFSKDQRIKMFFRSAHIELTWYNTGTVPVEFDVYTYVYKKQPLQEQSSLVGAYLAGSNVSEPLQIYTANAPPVTSPSAIPNLGNRGVTPFDVPHGCKFSGGTIIKTERFVIAPGQVITKTHRDGKHKMFTADDDDTQIESVYQKRGWTVSFLSLYRSHGGTADQAIRCRQTKSYRWTMEGVKTPKVSYVSV